MLFPLKNLEAYIEDRFLIIGETLFEQGKVTALSEAERHLWVANVVGREVEVQITPTKVRACTCECDNYKEAGICEHVAAVLFKLRKAVDKVKEKKDNKRKKRNTVVKKLTTATILDNVTAEELKYFIRDYAKGNRTFGLALKARFAASVPMADDREKYYQLLESTINESRTTTDRILYSGKLKIIKIVKELLAQTDDYIVGGNFTDAFYILQAIIEKCAPLHNKVEGATEKYVELIEKAFQLLRTLLKANLAPAMREDIWLFCLEECKKTTYYLSDFVSLLLDILLGIAKNSTKRTQLIEVIDKHIETHSISGQRKAALLIYKLTLLEKEGKKKQAEAVVLENLTEPTLLIYVAEKSLEVDNFKRARYLVEKGLQTDMTKRTRAKLESLLLIIAKKEGNISEVITYSRKLFLYKKDISNYLTLKEVIKVGEWSPFLKTLLSELENQPFSMEKRDVIAEIYAKEEDELGLLEYIESIRSLDLLQRYDVLLLKKNKKKVADLYLSILDSFIKHHLGRQSSERIRLAILHLYKIKADSIANRIVKNFRMNYPERFTLIEELARF